MDLCVSTSLVEEEPQVLVMEILRPLTLLLILQLYLQLELIWFGQ